jgi:hypothetical protein
LGIVSPATVTTTPDRIHENPTLKTLTPTAMVLGFPVSPAPCSVMPPTVITPRKGMLRLSTCTKSVA